MREIKFRSWDEENKKMVYSEKDYCNYTFDFFNVALSCSVNNNVCDIFGDEHERWETLDNLMQYTGLKDKNGKEIYEGDVVKGIIPEIANEPERIGIVKWGLYSWIIDFKLPKYAPGIGMVGFCSFRNYEVIGNIYENPNLLGEE